MIDTEIDLSKGFLNMKRVLMLFIALLIVSSVSVGVSSAQSEELSPITFTLYRDEESLTMVFLGAGEVPFHSIRIEAEEADERRTEIYLEQRYATFRTLNLLPLDRPTCLRIEWQEAGLPFPNDCLELSRDQRRVENNVAPTGIFWYENDVRVFLPLIIFQGETQIGFCDGGGESVKYQVCELTFTPQPMPTLTTPTPASSPEPTSTLTMTPSSCIVTPELKQEQAAHEMAKVPGTCALSIPYDYWIDLYEVRSQQYESCVSVDVCEPIEPPSYWNENLPVVNVTFDQAQRYCDWAIAGRVPTRDEWQLAGSASGARFPWGEDPAEALLLARYAANSSNGTRNLPYAAARDQGTSWAGVHNLSGNVAEWVGSVFDVGFIGGSFLDSVDGIALDTYIPFNRTHSALDVGFRCVRLMY